MLCRLLQVDRSPLLWMAMSLEAMPPKSFTCVAGIEYRFSNLLSCCHIERRRTK